MFNWSTDAAYCFHPIGILPRIYYAQYDSSYRGLNLPYDSVLYRPRIIDVRLLRRAVSSPLQTARQFNELRCCEYNQHCDDLCFPCVQAAEHCSGLH